MHIFTKPFWMPMFILKMIFKKNSNFDFYFFAIPSLHLIFDPFMHYNLLLFTCYRIFEVFANISLMN
jgi:hypothetical protein